MKRIKKLVSVVLVLSLVMVLGFGSSAATSDSDVSVMSAQSITATLSFSGFTATAACNVTTSGAEKISTTLYLQKYKDGSWTSVKSKSATSTTGWLQITFTKLVTAGTFRVKVVSTVTTDSGTTTNTRYSSSATKE